mgnify:CR=1 FL=1
MLTSKRCLQNIIHATNVTNSTSEAQLTCIIHDRIKEHLNNEKPSVK